MKTGRRLDSQRPALQNIPIRTEIARRLREALVPKGAIILTSYSQIEIRILEWLAKREGQL